MLQIITGKFFTSSDLYVTRHRGVMFSNYHHLLEPIRTDVGVLLPAEPVGDVSAMVYEVDQRLEATTRDGERSMLVAVSPDYLIQDFAAVVAFALRVTCTPDVELTRRLTQPSRSALGIPAPPRTYVARVFEKRLVAEPNDEALLRDFVRDLVALKRPAYEAAMRAVRRYVVGLHRIGDDLDLAYALLVASIESLAQEFDAFSPVWADYDPGKRAALDTALTGVETEAADRVRAAILAHEHVALARRYREYALAHITPRFFREEAAAAPGPISRRDLEPALERAYRFRSTYVHTLRELPRVLTAVPFHTDIAMTDGKPALTFHGLARVAHHVITEFVRRAPNVEREDYNYWATLPGTVQMPVGERYWIWRAENYERESSRRFLTGFLSELSAVWMGEPDSRLTDIRPVLEKIETSIGGLAASSRLPMITLYVLFHRSVTSEWHRPEWVKFAEPYGNDFDVPGIESLIAHVVTDSDLDWTTDECSRLREAYFAQRFHKNGIRITRAFEAAMTLALAEHVRRAGDEARARELIGEAVESLPGHERLLSFERGTASGSLPSIKWREILLPPRTAN